MRGAPLGMFYELLRDVKYYIHAEIGILYCVV